MKPIVLQIDLALIWKADDTEQHLVETIITSILFEKVNNGKFSDSYLQLSLIKDYNFLAHYFCLSDFGKSMWMGERDVCFLIKDKQ